MTIASNAPRKQQKAARIAWLAANSARFSTMDLDAIAREMQSAGLYSAKTSLVDIRLFVRSHLKKQIL